MALRSMTGYGCGQASKEGAAVRVELNSVNRKQLDIQIALPRALHALMPRIHETVAESLQRGRVTGEISLRWSADRRRRSVRIDAELARGYLDAARRGAKRLGLSDDISAEFILRQPEVLTSDLTAHDETELWALVHPALCRALKQLNLMRRREGRALQRDVLDRLAFVRGEVRAIQARSPVVTASYRDRLKRRIAEAGVKTPDGDASLRRELLLFAERSDITEEITRLQTHLREGARMMRARDASGRALDFLAQECFREINTIASKAHDGEIAARVIACKAELDKIREQLQNIE